MKMVIEHKNAEIDDASELANAQVLKELWEKLMEREIGQVNF